MADSMFCEELIDFSYRPETEHPEVSFDIFIRRS